MSGDVRASLLATAGAVIVSVTVAGVRAQLPPSRAPVRATREVLPLLSNDGCASQGPAALLRKTSLRADARGGAFAVRGVIEPGNAAERLVIEMVTHPDPRQRMPPPESGH